MRRRGVSAFSVGRRFADSDQRDLFQSRELVLFIGLALGGRDLLNRGPRRHGGAEVLAIHFVENGEI